MLTQQRDYNLSADYDARYVAWEARRRREDMMPEINRDGRPGAILWFIAVVMLAGILGGVTVVTWIFG